MRSLTFAFASLLLATPAFAADRAPAKGSTATSVVDPDKVVCKREVEIGSLVAAKKTCLTKREWAARRLSAQDDTRRMQETSGGPQ